MCGKHHAYISGGGFNSTYVCCKGLLGHALNVVSALDFCPAVQGAPGEEPVWRQMLHHLASNGSDPAVVQEAAAALAE